MLEYRILTPTCWTPFYPYRGRLLEEDPSSAAEALSSVVSTKEENGTHEKITMMKFMEIYMKMTCVEIPTIFLISYPTGIPSLLRPIIA